MSNHAAAAKNEMIAAQLALRERSRKGVSSITDIWVVTEQDAGVIKARPAYEPDAISQQVSVVAGALCFLGDEILVIKVGGRWFTLGATRGGFTDADVDVLVESVNGLVGAVVLDADDISDASTVRKFVSAMEKAKLAGISSGATANDTDANLKDRANHTGTQAASTISNFSSAADARITAQKATNNGLATLDSVGKIPSAQLPAIVMTDVNSVSSQGAQLALVAQEGDVAVRTDENKTYIHNGGTAGTMADWTLLATPTDVVQSVNGKTGSVSLTTTDITEGTNLYYPDADKTKLASIAPNAEANVQSDWAAGSGGAAILNKPTLGTAAAQNSSAFATAAQGTNADTAVQPGDLATVATSGDYDDLTGKPTIPTVPSTIVESVTAGANITVDNSDPANPVISTGGAAASVTSVNGQTGVVVLDADHIADTASNILMSPSERTKLSGIAAGATANASNASLRDRATHTGDQAIATITGLQSELDGKALLGRHAVTIESFSPVNTTVVNGNYSARTELLTGTLSDHIPAITTGTWDVEVSISALVYRSVTTGGVFLDCGNGGGNYRTVLGRNFLQTGGYTLSLNMAFSGYGPANVIDIRYAGFSTPGTTNIVTYSCLIVATRKT